jgi:deazaflavin-dependent oxidoreductase (nitroreductase family)
VRRQTKLRHVDPYARRGALYRTVCRLSRSRTGMWLSQHVAWKLDPYLLRVSRGRISSTGPLASAVLETVGARSGRARRNATLYFHDGGSVIVVASKLGSHSHPAWYHNLRAHPEVMLGGLPFSAETVEDDADARRLWMLADRVFPPFADYRRWAAEAGREIPLVRLRPR